MKFIMEFPIGTTLSNFRFDQWAHKNKYFKVPRDAPTGSDAWLAHLQRRHQLRGNMFKASTHPRMQEQGGECFRLVRTGPDTLLVESTATALTHGHFATKLDSLINTKRKQLSYLMQSQDATQMFDYQRAIGEELFNEIDEWNDDVHRKTLRLDAKFSRLVKQIQKDVDAGLIKPTNGGIKRLLDGTVRDNDEDEDA
jgi:hypothetical protein